MIVKKKFIVALIRTTDDDFVRWLGLWNVERYFWDFLICEQLQEESIQEILAREVSWRLELDRQAFLVANMSQLHVNPLSENANPDEQSEVELIFNGVDVYRESTLRHLAQRDDCRWLSAKELCSGMTEDGQTINPRLQNWLNRWRVIQHWE